MDPIILSILLTFLGVIIYSFIWEITFRILNKEENRQYLKEVREEAYGYPAIDDEIDLEIKRTCNLISGVYMVTYVIVVMTLIYKGVIH